MTADLPRIEELARELAARPRDGRGAAPPAAALLRASTADVDRIRLRFPALDDHELSELETAQGRFLEENGRLLARRGQDDVASEAASLALDLASDGRPELAERLFSELASAAQDFDLYSVIDFHQRRHALARAAASDEFEEARRWLLLGLATRRERVVPPSLVAVGGKVASGKSSLARMTALRMGAAHIEADRVRRHLTADEGLSPLEPDLDETVYAELLRRAERVLESGRPALLDACFPRASQRERAGAMARERGWPFLFIECRVDEATARARLAERDDPGDEGSWLELYEALESRWQDTRHLPDAEKLVLDCTRPLEESDARIRERIPTVPAGHELP